MNMKKVISALLATLLIVLTFAQVPISAQEWNAKTTNDVNKVWKLRFNVQIDSKSLSKDNVYVTDGKNIHPTTLSTSSNGYVVEVKPTILYKKGIRYQLIMNKTLKSVKGFNLKTSIEFPFQVGDTLIPMEGIESTINSYFTTVTVVASSNIYKVTLGGEEMAYKGNNTFTSTQIDLKSGTVVTINYYDEDNKLIESKKHTIGTTSK